MRPPLPRELNGDKRFQNIARIEIDRSITLSENLPALDDPRSDEATAVMRALLQMAVAAPSVVLTDCWCVRTTAEQFQLLHVHL